VVEQLTLVDLVVILDTHGIEVFVFEIVDEIGGYKHKMQQLDIYDIVDRQIQLLYDVLVRDDIVQLGLQQMLIYVVLFGLVCEISTIVNN
jgi:hypothetical protein